MTFPHPASKTHVRLHEFLWRFFTGHHLDGKIRTNATWFTPGTAPKHHVNWWTGKPRFRRMMWRWFMVIVPVSWYTVYQFMPSFRVNVLVLVTLSVAPYLIHHGTMRAIRMLPERNVIFVTDHIPVEHVDSELDVITAAPNEFPDSDIEAIVGFDATKELEADDIPSKPRTRRRS